LTEFNCGKLHDAPEGSVQIVLSWAQYAGMLAINKARFARATTTQVACTMRSHLPRRLVALESVFWVMASPS
jgi:hypothetical protein